VVCSKCLFCFAELVLYDCRKDHSFHALLVGAYKEYARSLCLDLRCVGIVILQIYTLSVFSTDECEKLMHWPVSRTIPLLVMRS
jgi:hypothetical protein